MLVFLKNYFQPDYSGTSLRYPKEFPPILYGVNLKPVSATVAIWARATPMTRRFYRLQVHLLGKALAHLDRQWIEFATPGYIL